MLNISDSASATSTQFLPSDAELSKGRRSSFYFIDNSSCVTQLWLCLLSWPAWASTTERLNRAQVGESSCWLPGASKAHLCLSEAQLQSLCSKLHLATSTLCCDALPWLAKQKLLTWTSQQQWADLFSSSSQSRRFGRSDRFWSHFRSRWGYIPFEWLIVFASEVRRSVCEMWLLSLTEYSSMIGRPSQEYKHSKRFKAVSSNIICNVL